MNIGNLETLPKKNGLNLLFFSKTDLWDSHTFLSMYSTIRIIIHGSVNIQTSHGSVMGIATLFISLAQMQYLPTFTINSIHSSIHKYSSPIRRICLVILPIFYTYFFLGTTSRYPGYPGYITKEARIIQDPPMGWDAIVEKR